MYFVVKEGNRLGEGQGLGKVQRNLTMYVNNDTHRQREREYAYLVGLEHDIRRDNRTRRVVDALSLLPHISVAAKQRYCPNRKRQKEYHHVAAEHAFLLLENLSYSRRHLRREKNNSHCYTHIYSLHKKKKKKKKQEVQEFPEERPCCR
jgi:hypothetical protein